MNKIKKQRKQWLFATKAKKQEESLSVGHENFHPPQLTQKMWENPCLE